MSLVTVSGSQRKLIFAGVSLLATFIVGLLIGKFAIPPQENGANLSGMPRAIIQEADDTIHEKLTSRIRAENIRENLRQLTSKPHLAGTPADYIQAKELADLWMQQGFDDVAITPYDVLLSYPDPARPNVVRLRGQNDELLYESPEKEAILTPRENVPDVVPPFIAYSAPGIVKGQLVYVNYGRDEDFKYVTDTALVNVTGKIAIARYGKIFRGDKVRAAQKYGAIGLIIYSDPEDYAKGSNSSDVYPNSWWLPPTGAQRGSIYVTDGDPETPGYPSISTAYRVPQSEITHLPRIPVHPISYGVAEQLMKEAEMAISTSNQRRTIHNTIGVITGSVEPDRYVILGNHRDAWVFGAMDPSSGSAVMMEAARVVAESVRSGEWRPRRSIVFCSWGAEEYGLLGSNEWVEEYVKTLGARTVAYLNVDTAVSGNHSIAIAATPLLYRAVYEATKRALLSSYPLYHSVYETFYAMEKFYDPDFKIHASVTSLWVELARSLADALVLPYNVSDYGVMLEQSRVELDNNHGELLRQRIANYSALKRNIEDFQTVADDFMKQMTTINKNDPLAIRKVNDQMMQLERAFIDPAGLPGRSYFRYVRSLWRNVL
ncbi:N-acetylated-alpha-linked acidic dipeptidase 2-like [Haliotis asinina]|uniref:N-acetylated-alpha-linked acidic dipeptidase 2-like n=1 Tax=Haliotis asinina TaxID=109174 RepID=UPI003531F238